MKNWHVAHKENLSFGDRVADSMRKLMASWFFVIGFLFFLVVWMHTGGFGSDPRPYGLLNLALSTIAGIQASLIMIAAKRLDDISAKQAQHDFEVNVDADKRIKELQKINSEMHELLVSNTDLVREIHSITKSVPKKRK